MKYVWMIILMLLTPSVVSATSWAYEFVVWNGSEYKLTDEYVAEVEERLGEVTSYSSMEQRSGHFSNVYERGTGYFKISGISAEEALAVEDGDRYRVAEKIGDYAYGSPYSATVNGVIIVSFVGVGVLFAGITGISLYYMKKG